MKVCFTGDSGVGKTSLMRREVHDQFTEEFLATIGCDFYVKTYSLPTYDVKVQYWDTAGQERFRSITFNYFRGSNLVCLCFSLHDRNSFQNLETWLKEIRRETFKGMVCLIGCKSDLEIEVPTDEILVFAQEHNC